MKNHLLLFRVVWKHVQKCSGRAANDSMGTRMIERDLLDLRLLMILDILDFILKKHEYFLVKTLQIIS